MGDGDLCPMAPHSGPGGGSTGTMTIAPTASSISVQLKSKANQLVAAAPEFTPAKNAQDFSEEVAAASRWWSSKMRQQDLATYEVESFETCVRNQLTKHYTGHWYPSDP